MVFPILGGNGAGEEQYLIDNSLRFNDAEDTSLLRTGISGTLSKAHTFSVWIKRDRTKPSGRHMIAGMGDGSGNISWLMFNNDSLIYYATGSGTYALTTTAKYRDLSAWYHVVAKVDTTQSTASDRFKFYVNGVEQSFTGTILPQNHQADMDAQIVAFNSSDVMDGYMAEFHFLDGVAYDPTYFGEFDEDSGIWKPIEYTGGNYGTFGFYLDFENSGNFGADQSGNGNNFTVSNLTSTDQTTDTPTNNFATLNPLDNDSDTTFSEGNTKFVTDSVERRPFYSTYGLTTGKWYWEVKGTVNTAVGYLMIGIAGSNNTATEPLGNNLYDYSYRPDSGNIYNNGSSSSYGNTFTDNDIIGIALDLDNNKLYFSKNGTFQNSGDPTSGATGTGAVSITDPSSTDKGCYIPSASDFWTAGSVTGFFNFGNPAFSISSGNSDGNGYGNFEYAPPSGYLALCTQNLATALSPTIDDGSAYFSATKYQGGGFSAQSITGVGFQPDWVWVKNRTVSASHVLYDSNRGVQKALFSDSTSAETTRSGLTSFDSDGFSLGSAGTENGSSSNEYISWNWKANGGTTSSNTDGSITSTVQANTTAGFSIVTYTGTGLDATVGHGLNVAPDMVIVKSRDAARNWPVYHRSLGGDDSLKLNLTDATTTSLDCWNDLDPTSTVVHLGTTGGSNVSGENAIMYCFHSVEGYSKFGSYTGNGSTDGTFVYTGFRPAFIIGKNTTLSGPQWFIFDSKISPYNVIDTYLYASNNPAESGGTDRVDFLSNGFKWRNTALAWNGSHTYIYMAFAENPFASSSGVPVVAR